MNNVSPNAECSNKRFYDYDTVNPRSNILDLHLMW